MKKYLVLSCACALLASCGQDPEKEYVYVDPPPAIEEPRDYFIDTRAGEALFDLNNRFITAGLENLDFIHRIDVEFMGTSNTIEGMSSCEIDKDGKYFIVLNSYFVDQYFDDSSDYTVRVMLAREIGACRYRLPYETDWAPVIDMMWEFITLSETLSDFDARWDLYVHDIKNLPSSVSIQN